MRKLLGTQEETFQFSSLLRYISGVMFPPMDQLTKQGFDMQFGANTLGI